MDDHWETEIIEYGAINITGFRLLDMNQWTVKEFLEEWKSLDPISSPGAGKNTISVREILFYFYTLSFLLLKSAKQRSYNRY